MTPVFAIVSDRAERVSLAAEMEDKRNYEFATEIKVTVSTSELADCSGMNGCNGRGGRDTMVS